MSRIQTIDEPAIFVSQIHTQMLKKSFISNANLGGPDVFKRIKPNFEKFCSHNGIAPTYIE
jgi:hypothetical protein